MLHAELTKGEQGKSFLKVTKLSEHGTKGGANAQEAYHGDIKSK